LTTEIKEEIKMKKITAIILVIISLFAGVGIGIGATTEKPTTTEKTFDWLQVYDGIADDLELLKVYNSADLTAEILENRNGDLIIEKIYGIVIDAEGNGKILEGNEDFKKAHNREYNSIAEHNHYISYKRVAEAEQGDIILTYCIYNPDSSYTDDIIFRFDYIMDNVED
jgi:hypothetical protein